MPSVTRTAAKPAPSGHRRAELERQVLRALEALLADGTAFTQLPVGRIAAQSQIARSTFYRHFPDKSQLLIRMSDLATTDIMQAAENGWQSDHTDGPAGLVATMAAMTAAFRRHRLLLRALGEVAAYDHDVARYWLGRLNPFIQLVRTRLERWHAEGKTRPDLDPTATAHILTWMVERSLNVHFTTPDNRDDDPADSDHRLAHALGHAIWHTIYTDDH